MSTGDLLRCPDCQRTLMSNELRSYALEHLHDMNDVNHDGLPSEQSVIVQPDALAKRHRPLGPAIPIAVGTTIGGLVGLCAVHMKITPVGIVLMFLRSLAGGLYFRFRSVNWPIDPNARWRRFGFAILWTILPPSFTVIVTGMRGQGVSITILMALIGLSVAAGILASGDRRSGNDTG